MEKRLIYICSPLSHPTAEGIQSNMKKAGEYARKVGKMLHCRAIAPHAFLPEYLNDNIPKERELALKFGLDLLKICDGICICGDVVSKGMEGEINFAKENDIPIFYFNESSSGLVSKIILSDGTEMIKRVG